MKVQDKFNPECITIVIDKWGGKYCGGRFLAVNKAIHEIPEKVWSDDVKFFEEAKKGRSNLCRIGVGETAEEARENLIILL